MASHVSGNRAGNAINGTGKMDYLKNDDIALHSTHKNKPKWTKEFNIK